jgi:hypothetical protein
MVVIRRPLPKRIPSRKVKNNMHIWNMTMVYAYTQSGRRTGTRGVLSPVYVHISVWSRNSLPYRWLAAKPHPFSHGQNVLSSTRGLEGCAGPLYEHFFSCLSIHATLPDFMVCPQPLLQAKLAGRGPRLETPRSRLQCQWASTKLVICAPNHALRS